MTAYNSSTGDDGKPVRLHPLMVIPVPWVFILTYLAGVGLQYALPITIHSPWIATVNRICGAVLMALGLAIATWCLWLFHSTRTTTVPGKASAQLVTSGPYRFSRNPMYVSLTLMYLGEAGLLAQVWPIFTLPLVLIYAQRVLIPVEESRLHEVFGEAYERFCARTRRWI